MNRLSDSEKREIFEAINFFDDEMTEAFPVIERIVAKHISMTLFDLANDLHDVGLSVDPYLRRLEIRDWIRDRAKAAK